jgi:hypothetical protein
MHIEDVWPVHVAGYIEQLQVLRKAPTVKQHLACIRVLFDWLVTGQVLPSNPRACGARRLAPSTCRFSSLSSGRDPPNSSSNETQSRTIITPKGNGDKKNLG